VKLIAGAAAGLLVVGLGIAGAQRQAEAEDQIEAQPLGPAPAQSPAQGQIQIPAAPLGQAPGPAPSQIPAPPAGEAPVEAPAQSGAPAPAPVQSGAPAAAQAPDQTDRVAVLQGLDKITARVSRFDAPVDQSVRFGTLVITVRACDKAPPEEPPNTVAFLQIDKVQPGDAKTTVAKQIFSGWMFASSPAVSSLEDPVYDINVLDCKSDATASPGNTSVGK
jgi:hypothetical protein